MAAADMSAAVIPADAALVGLLRPASVAVVGASNDLSKPGARTVLNLRRSAPDVRVYPVNTRYETLFGLKCHARIADLPEVPDLAIFAMPAEHVVAGMRDCAAAGIRNVIIFTAGFAETGEAGRGDQREIAAIARAHGINVLGPNCAGLWHIAARRAFCFSPYFEPDTWRPGNFALLVQGGGLGAAVWDGQDRGVGFSWLVTLGNEAVLDCSDFIRAMTADADTRVVGLILEGVKKGDAFRAAVAEAHARGKFVVAMHQGRTSEGRQAAALHTGVLATADAANAAVLHELGVPRATDLDELYNLGALFSRYGAPQGKGVCVVSISGGAGTLGADLAAFHGIALPQPAAETTAELKKILVSYASAANPMDLTTAVYRDPDMMYRAVMLAVADPVYAAVVVPIPFYYPGIMDSVCIAVMRAAAESRKPIVVAWLAQGVDKPARTMMERAGVHVIAGSDLCMRVLGKYVAYAPVARPVAERGDAVASLPAGSGRILQENAAKPLLAAYGIPVPRERLVRERADLAAALATLKGPLAMKVISDDILHKAAIGGVRLGIAGSDAVARAYDEISAAVAAACPDAHVDGILLQEMAEGFELVLGARFDPVWGPMVMVGLGGNLTEVVADVALHTAPLDLDQARAMLATTRAHAGMQRLGFGAGDDAVAEAIVALGRFIADHRRQVATVDANPLMVSRAGRVMLVDAVIERAHGSPGGGGDD